jgi:ATP-binding cassette subfamily F protein 3
LNSKDVLLEALQRFSGTVLFVSHDRFFIEELATRVLELQCGASPRLYHGNYQYYLQKKELDAGNGAEAATPISNAAVTTAANREVSAVSADRPAAEALDSKSQRELDKKRKAEQRRLSRREEELLEAIDRLDTAHRIIKEVMSNPQNYCDGQRMKKLQLELEENEAASLAASAEWEEVARELEQYRDL